MSKKILLILILLIIPFVSAFGVNSQYWDTNPLVMYPGETREIQLTLQNMVGEKDMSLQAEISEGKEIASLTDKSNTYLVPFGKKDVPVNIKVIIPSDAKIGDKKEIMLLFKELNNEQGGMIQMSGSVGTKIPILIKSQEETEWEIVDETPEINIWPFVIILAIIVIVLAVFYFGKIKKGKKASK